MFDIEALYEAESVAHAITLLKEHPEAKIIAGGSDVLLSIREGKLAGCSLVSLQKLDELRGVTLDGEESLRIGPMTSFRRLTRDPLIQKLIPVLGEAADQVGGPQIRSIGTIGGNVCNGVTSADSGSTLVAWEAVMEYTGPNGVRTLPITEHYIKAGQVALQPTELVTAILIPKASYDRCFGHYIKYAMRNAMDIATLGCSVNVRLSADRTAFERVRIGFGVAGPVPMRAPKAEEAAAGRPVCEETLTLAGQAALQDVNPRTSWRASKELRLQLTEELCRRALREAAVRAGGCF